ADLVAVGVFGDADVALRREDRDAHRLFRGVAEVVRAVRAFREADGVAGLDLALAFGRAQRRPAGDDDQPFLVGPLEVVRADRLARRQVVDAHPEPLRADLLADARCGALLVARRLAAVGAVFGRA